MIPENSNVPICRDHGERITRCNPCQKRLVAFERSMVRVTAAPWRSTMEPATNYHNRVDRAEEENRERLHSWAVAYLYVDDKMPF
jgi:hypothetical protein